MGASHNNSVERMSTIGPLYNNHKDGSATTATHSLVDSTTIQSVSTMCTTAHCQLFSTHNTWPMCECVFCWWHCLLLLGMIEKGCRGPHSYCHCCVTDGSHWRQTTLRSIPATLPLDKIHDERLYKYPTIPFVNNCHGADASVRTSSKSLEYLAEVHE